jgi:hypothetical protein
MDNFTLNNSGDKQADMPMKKKKKKFYSHTTLSYFLQRKGAE